MGFEFFILVNISVRLCVAVDFKSFMWLAVPNFNTLVLTSGPFFPRFELYGLSPMFYARLPVPAFAQPAYRFRTLIGLLR